jgi:hypothetical protein
MYIYIYGERKMKEGRKEVKNVEKEGRTMKENEGRKQDEGMKEGR